MIFLDTSVIYAMADRADPRHERAKEYFRAVLEAGEPVVTHNYVLVESMALIQHRLGLAPALQVAESSRALEMEWIDKDLHDEAVRRLAANKRRRVSLVDQVSFIVMRLRGIGTALTFDEDFAAEGFRLYEV